MARQAASGDPRRSTWREDACYHGTVFRLRRRRADDPNTVVLAWKRSWVAGAQARWSNGSASNPYPRSPEHAAWNAGYVWAGDHPDRRTADHFRLAHPLRRSTDTIPRVVRAVEIGAAGFGLLAAARWAWRARRRTREAAASRS